MTRVPLPPLDDPVPVMVAPWEIECCRPPPVVGGFTTWRLELTLIADPSSFWLPPAVSRLVWDVEEWPSSGGPHRLLTRGGLRAVIDAVPFMSSRPVTLPGTGRHRLTGTLSGHGHGGGDLDGSPRTTAVVQALAVATTDYTVHERSWVSDASLWELRPTRESPRWFSDRPIPGSGRIRRSEALVMWLS